MKETDSISHGKSLEHRVAMLSPVKRHLLQRMLDTRLRANHLLLKNTNPTIDIPDPHIRMQKQSQGTVIDDFLQMVKENGQRTALIEAKSTVTYADLHKLAEELAVVLRIAGLTKDTVVGIHGKGCLGLVVSILATMYNASIFCLIDQELPSRRKQSIIDRSRIATLIDLSTDSGIQLKNIPTIRVDPVTAKPEYESNEISFDNKLIQPHEDSQFYINFTSGSTGTPKGVKGRHLTLTRFIHWQIKKFSIGQDDRVAQLTPPGFDAILREIFLPLTCGGVIVIPAFLHNVHSADEILTWLDEQKITVIHTTPSVISHWLRFQKSFTNLKHLRWIFFVGEPLTDMLVNHWRETYPNCRAGIVNLYGLAETTMAELFYRVPNPPISGIQPLGYPIPGTQGLILQQDKLCKTGEVGEIMLRTPYHSLGYIDDQLENHCAFTTNPFTLDKQDVVLRTGDYGRYRSDGTIEFVGRQDDLVKIRGVRVYPVEVEQILKKHKSVHNSFVAANNSGGKPRLIAWVEAQEVNEEILRQHLFAELPPPMIPEKIIIVDKFPLLRSGKIDYQSLKINGIISTRNSKNTLKDRMATRDSSRLEALLYAIWTDLIEEDNIGFSDSFFELGGNSLLAIELLWRCSQAGFSFELDDLIREPTIKGLVKLQQQPHHRVKPAGNDKCNPLVVLRTSGNRIPLIFVHSTNGPLFEYGCLIKELGSNQPCYGFQIRSNSLPPDCDSSLETLARHYVSSLLESNLKEPFHLVGFCLGGTIAIEIATQLKQAGMELGSLNLIDTFPPHLPKGFRKDIDRAWFYFCNNPILFMKKSWLKRLKFVMIRVLENESFSILGISFERMLRG